MNIDIKDIENLFKEKKNCAQIISTYFARELNLNEESILRASARKVRRAFLY